MRFGSRWQRIQTYTSLAAWSALALQDDDEFTWRDTPETLALGIRLGLIWSPQIALAIPAAAGLATPLAILEGAALVGLGASYAIGGAEGAGQYVEYITHPQDIHKSPKKTEALLQAHRITQGVMTLGLSEVTRAGSEIIWDYRKDIFKNRWMTGPYLPF